VPRPSSADHGRSELRERPTLARALSREQNRLGSLLRELRQERGLSQEQAAERIGLSDKQLRRIELGQANVTLATLVACAMAYKVELKDLFAG
jgi:DNA-binding XRE family transcriptional regulator